MKLAVAARLLQQQTLGSETGVAAAAAAGRAHLLAHDDLVSSQSLSLNQSSQHWLFGLLPVYRSLRS